MAETFWFTCDGCYDLTLNEPDNRGVCLCENCGGAAASGDGESKPNTRGRDVDPVPASITQWLLAKKIA